MPVPGTTMPLPKPVIALDETDHHAVGISGTEVNRAAPRWLASAWLEGAFTDQGAALSGVSFTEQTSSWHVSFERISRERECIAEAQFHRLEL